jgi:glyoxylase-like metal-dependent hydrolase (beta-lactamase superfamily II)
MLRTLLAPNASAMTLEGTRTHLVGARRVAIIDPGPAMPSHRTAIEDALALAGAESAVILLTHTHPDHDGGAADLSRRLGAAVLGVAAGTMRDGDVIGTDGGDLTVVATPGHTPDHASFWWPAERTLFCGDLLMGGLDTTVVAVPEGDLGEYLASLERVRGLRPRRIVPAHGPDIEDADSAIDRYIEHRMQRQRQVLAALKAGAGDAAVITERIYGSNIPRELEWLARSAVEAYLEHLRRSGRVERAPGGEWREVGDG